MYLVVKTFIDLQDKNHLYEVGDEYPREGLTPTPERVKELASEANKQGTPLIKEVKAPAKKGGKKASKK